MKNIALIIAGGIGVRMEQDIPKQWKKIRAFFRRQQVKMVLRNLALGGTSNSTWRVK